MSVIVTVDRVADLMQTIAEIANVGKVLVGIPEDKNARDDSPIGNAAIGYINEFGSPAQGIPPRPFLMPGIKKVQKQAANLLGVGAAQALTAMNPAPLTVAQNKVGLLGQNSVRAAITEGEGFAPLAPATIRARLNRTQTPKSMTVKGKPRTMKPLIDTGSLRTSITYVIRKGAN